MPKHTTSQGTCDLAHLPTREAVLPACPRNIWRRRRQQQHVSGSSSNNSGTAPVNKFAHPTAKQPCDVHERLERNPFVALILCTHPTARRTPLQRNAVGFTDDRSCGGATAAAHRFTLLLTSPRGAATKSMHSSLEQARWPSLQARPPLLPPTVHSERSSKPRHLNRSGGQQQRPGILSGAQAGEAQLSGPAQGAGGWRAHLPALQLHPRVVRPQLGPHC
jgi:hypothetical protein